MNLAKGNSDNMQQWSTKLITESMFPKNLERMKSPSGSAAVTGPCGDTIEFFIMTEGKRIMRACFQTNGCGVTRACGSVATQLANGMALWEAFNMKPEMIISALNGVPDDHEHCATLCITGLRCAIIDCAKKHGWGEMDG
jgi:nitrogen fixation NifU-like protein